MRNIDQGSTESLGGASIMSPEMMAEAGQLSIMDVAAHAGPILASREAIVQPADAEPSAEQAA